MSNNSKIKTDLIMKLSKLCLSKKENILFHKIVEKGTKNLNDNDLEFLRLLYDLHYHPVFSAGGMDIYPWEQAELLKKEVDNKREKAAARLKEEPYSLWFKNSKHYK